MYSLATTRQTASTSPTSRLTDLVNLEAYNNWRLQVNHSLAFNHEKSYTTTTVLPSTLCQELWPSAFVK